MAMELEIELQISNINNFDRKKIKFKLYNRLLFAKSTDKVLNYSYLINNFNSVLSQVDKKYLLGSC